MHFKYFSALLFLLLDVIIIAASSTLVISSLTGTGEFFQFSPIIKCSGCQYGRHSDAASKEDIPNHVKPTGTSQIIQDNLAFYSFKMTAVVWNC